MGLLTSLNHYLISIRRAHNKIPCLRVRQTIGKGTSDAGLAKKRTIFDTAVYLEHNNMKHIFDNKRRAHSTPTIVVKGIDIALLTHARRSRPAKTTDETHRWNNGNTAPYPALPHAHNKMTRLEKQS
ncbi:hypothetical protein e1012e08.tmp0191 [Eimeria tenella]|uniref:Uncharacterized protein n=1 Tax=Eimeria tenella TaxID=5802 RepID=C8TDL4_EIMTE|nr:hypothetical protein e1012e08.tmp0191 [Eimeria tenella]